MTPKVAHNAVASIVEMYREALNEQETRIVALLSENSMLRSTLTEKETKITALTAEFAVLKGKKDEQVA